MPADVATAGKTSVVWEGGKPVVSFPIPGVPTATATATLDAKFMAERVVVRHGTNTTEFVYSDYRDWNNPLHPAEAFVAGRMTERRNGTVVRDITTTWTETGQMYVVMPVPASVKAAIKPTLQPPAWVSAFGPTVPLAGPPAPAPAPAAQVVTPRLANGKPDMTGSWTAVAGTGNGGAGAYNPPFPANRRCGPTQTRCKVPNDNFVVDYAWISPSRYWMNLNGPIYKPEYWDKVQELDMWTNKFDPIMTCQPMGIPRQGEPRRIFHTVDDITLFYTYSDYGGGNREYRMIPTNGGEHNANQARQATYLGYGVGKWEGDTLVVDSISFVDSTWLGRGGLFHSGDMRIVERFTRTGNDILHEMTIHDPESFVEPWVMPARTLRLGNGNALIAERAHCEIYEEERHHQSAATLAFAKTRSLRSLATASRLSAKPWGISAGRPGCPALHPEVPGPFISASSCVMPRQSDHSDAARTQPAPRSRRGVAGGTTPQQNIRFRITIFSEAYDEQANFRRCRLIGADSCQSVAGASFPGRRVRPEEDRAGDRRGSEVCVYEPARSAAYRTSRTRRARPRCGS